MRFFGLLTTYHEGNALHHAALEFRKLSTRTIFKKNFANLYYRDLNRFFANIGQYSAYLFWLQKVFSQHYDYCHSFKRSSPYCVVCMWGDFPCYCIISITRANQFSCSVIHTKRFCKTLAPHIHSLLELLGEDVNDHPSGRFYFPSNLSTAKR